MGPAATGTLGRLHRPQRTKLLYETEALNLGLCFGLAEVTVGLFPCRMDEDETLETQGQISPN